jgi:hypothetical protein
MGDIAGIPVQALLDSARAVGVRIEDCTSDRSDVHLWSTRRGLVLAIGTRRPAAAPPELGRTPLDGADLPMGLAAVLLRHRDRRVHHCRFAGLDHERALDVLEDWHGSAVTRLCRDLERRRPWPLPGVERLLTQMVILSGHPLAGGPADPDSLKGRPEDILAAVAVVTGSAMRLPEGLGDSLRQAVTASACAEPPTPALFTRAGTLAERPDPGHPDLTSPDPRPGTVAGRPRTLAADVGGRGAGSGGRGPAAGASNVVASGSGSVASGSGAAARCPGVGASASGAGAGGSGGASPARPDAESTTRALRAVGPGAGTSAGSGSAARRSGSGRGASGGPDAVARTAGAEAGAAVQVPGSRVGTPGGPVPPRPAAGTESATEALGPVGAEAGPVTESTTRALGAVGPERGAAARPVTESATQALGAVGPEGRARATRASGPVSSDAGAPARPAADTAGRAPEAGSAASGEASRPASTAVSARAGASARPATESATQALGVVGGQGGSSAGSESATRALGAVRPEGAGPADPVTRALGTVPPAAGAAARSGNGVGGPGSAREGGPGDGAGGSGAAGRLEHGGHGHQPRPAAGPMASTAPAPRTSGEAEPGARGVSPRPDRRGPGTDRPVIAPAPRTGPDRSTTAGRGAAGREHGTTVPERPAPPPRQPRPGPRVPHGQGGTARRLRPEHGGPAERTPGRPGPPGRGDT